MPTFMILIFIFIIAALSSGCQQASSAPPADGGPTIASKPAPAKPEGPKAVETEKGQTATDSEITASGSLATPTEAYKTAYELRKNKDISGLKKIMSKDILEFLSMMGEAEKKSLDDMLREMVEKPQAEKAEARNEKINGDRATLEYLTETGDWKTMDFEKANGKWLLAFPQADRIDEREAEK